MLSRVVRVCGRFLRAVVVGAVVVAALTLPGAPAQAQWGMGDFDAPDTLTKRGVAGYARILGFDKDQHESALALMEGNQTEYRAAMKEFKDKMAEFQRKAQEDQDWSGFQKEMPDIVEALQNKVLGLEKQFFDDLKAICTDEQLARWDSLERFRRREQFLKVAFISGAGVDMVEAVERTKSAPTGNTEFDEALAQYELDVDKPLQEMKRLQDDSVKTQKEMTKIAMEDPMKAMEAANKMMARFTELGKDLRTMNREYARRLEPMMPEEARAKFRAEIARRSFPRVYRETHAQKVLKAAEAMTDLTPDQKEQIGAARASYDRDAPAINERWAKAIEEEEDKNNGKFGVMMQGFMGDDDNAENPVADARKARRALDEKIEEKVTAVLTPAQKGKLPEKKVEPYEPWKEMMPQAEEDEESPAGGK